MSYSLATSATITPGANDAATMRPFESSGQRRRRSTDVRASMGLSTVGEYDRPNALRNLLNHQDVAAITASNKVGETLRLRKIDIAAISDKLQYLPSQKAVANQIAANSSP